MIDATAWLSVAVAVPKTTPLAVAKPAFVFAVLFAGQVITGNSASETVTVWVHVLTFPELSVATCITKVDPNTNIAGALFVIERIPTLDDAVATSNTTPLAVFNPKSVTTTLSAGQIIEGNCTLETVIIWVHVFVFPELSVAIYVTGVAPNANIKGALFVIDATALLSVAVAVPKTTPLAVLKLESVFTVISLGQVITGNSTSETVTVWVHVLTFPELSVAV
jgi:hypothetical protein